jgi:prephenate dehydratase
MHTLSELMQAVADDKQLLGVIPVENLLEGSVTETLETIGLQRLPLRPVLEWQHPIRHVLIQKTPALVPPQVIISHTQAIGQCRRTLEDRFGRSLSFVMVSSTSEAVRQLSEVEHPDETWAAIGTASAAHSYHLNVVSDNLSDLPDNKTRFWLIQHNDACPPPLDLTGDWKTSLCFGTTDAAGSLVDALLLFKDAGVSMSKIESRPSRQRLGEYLFYVDVRCDLSAPPYQALVAQLQQVTTHYTPLPAFPCITLAAITSPALRLEPTP